MFDGELAARAVNILMSVLSARDVMSSVSNVMYGLFLPSLRLRMAALQSGLFWTKVVRLSGFVSITTLSHQPHSQ